MQRGFHPPGHLKALGMLLLANVFWGLSFPLIKALILVAGRLLPESGETFLVAATGGPRFLLGALMLVTWLLWTGPKGGGPPVSREEVRQGLFMGLVTGMGMILQIDGMRFTAASTSAFLTQFYAILIPVCLALRRRQLPGITVWMSCLLVLAGVAILGRFNWREFRLGRGEVETLLSSVFFMVQIFLLDHPSFARSRPSRVTLVMFATEAVAFSAMALAETPRWTAFLVPWTSPAWVGLTLLLTVFCTVGAFSLMLAWQPKITATEAGLMYCTEPIFGTLFALVLPAVFSSWALINYPDEHATVRLLAGGGLITLANILIQLRPPPPHLS